MQNRIMVSAGWLDGLRCHGSWNSLSPDAPRLYSSPVVRRRRGVVSAGVRRTAPVRPACLSIAKAMRHCHRLGGRIPPALRLDVNRRSRRRAGCSSLGYICRASKRSDSRCSAKPKVGENARGVSESLVGGADPVHCLIVSTHACILGTRRAPWPRYYAQSFFIGGMGHEHALLPFSESSRNRIFIPSRLLARLPRCKIQIPSHRSSPS